MTSSQPGVLETIAETGQLSDESQASLRSAIETFKQSVPF